MSNFSNFKISIAKRRLKKDAKRLNRTRKFVNFNDAVKIGILYHLDSEETYRDIAGYVSSLQNKKKRVKIIGLFNGDLQPLYYIPKLSFDLLMSKDLNWYGKPKAEFVSSFLAEQFDVLFYFSNGNTIPLDYIFTLSNAKLKVSNGHEDIIDNSDFIIDVDEDDGNSQFLNTAIHYLSVINKNDDEK